LRRAFGVSLFLHVVAFTFLSWLLATAPQKMRPLAAALSVKLEERAPPPAPAPALILPQEKPAAAPAQRQPPRRVERRESAPVAPATTTVKMLSGEAARVANAQVARELAYPPEAIARGLEGETLVLLFLDETGNAIAARIESSSGHAILDEAAVRAARTLRSLPASAPREALVPVRFRLR